jgi:hypothetical protein
VLLIPAPPESFALLTRPVSDASTVQQWVLETVVAFDAEDGAAYVIGRRNRFGVLIRIDEITASEHFTLAAI